MIHRLHRVLGLVAILAIVRLLTIPDPLLSQPQTVMKLKIGTTAGQESPWGRALRAWKGEIEVNTGNTVSLDIFYNSSQGSENTMVNKMLAGQLDGVMATANSLSKIDNRMLVLNLPGLIQSGSTADTVLARFGPKLDSVLAAKRITLIAWTDFGFLRLLSRGFPVRIPDSLKGKRPWVNDHDPLSRTIYDQIGGTYPNPQDPEAVLPYIDIGLINCLMTTVVAAEKNGWAPKFDHGLDLVTGAALGAVVVSTTALERLQPAQRALVLSTGRAMRADTSGRLGQKARAEDDVAWRRFKSRCFASGIYTPDTIDARRWTGAFKTARTRLKASVVDSTLANEVESVVAALNDSPAPNQATIVMHAQQTIEYPKYNRPWGWFNTHTYDLGRIVTLNQIYGKTMAGPSEQKNKMYTWQVRISSDKTNWITVGTIAAIGGVESAFGPITAKYTTRYVQIFANGTGFVDFSDLTVVTQ